MKFDIKGKTAVVSGANRGIGEVITEALIGNGVGKVYAAVRNPDSVAALIEKHGQKVVAVEFDLASEELIQAAAEAASDAELLVNNAGAFRSATAFSDDVFDALDFEMDINLYGLIRTVRAFAPVLAANGGGAFVQLNSIVSMKCFPDFTTYCASKAASYAVTQALRTQLGAQGTAVFSVHPGPIATQMGDEAGLTPIAEPPSIVADAMLAAFESGSFHVFAGSMAQQMGGVYRPFAENVVEADMSEG